MPYAGWAMMRSGWKADDLYMHFEVGPYGAGHQHEDKLSMIIAGHGRRLLTEGGIYAYDSSPWRRYVLSARAHNVVMVDDMEQQRRGMVECYVASKPLPNRWLSNDRLDFAEGWYNEGFGSKNDQTVTHYRAVLFLKPEFWVVWDLLTPKDKVEHRYSTVFHLENRDAKVEPNTLTVQGTDPDAPNLAIIPLRRDALDVSIVKGQETPQVQGWVPAEHYEVRPIPTPVFQRQATGQWLEPWLLYPMSANAEPPVREVTVTDDGRRYTVTFKDGRKYVFEARLTGDALAKLVVTIPDASGNSTFTIP
jgi:hypothetical protein